MTAERFVGRDLELQQLRGLLDQAAVRRASTVLLGGEAGVGKSRLLAQFVADARKHHRAHVLRGACIELGNGLIPYAPLVESLRLLVRERGEEQIRAEVSDAIWDDLAHLVSDFTGTTVATGPEAAGPSGSGQLRVFGAVLRMLEHLGRTAPVVLVFEDMHWADQSTLDLVSFLARRLSSERALLVCSHRSGLIPGHALRVLLAEPEFKRHVHQVALPSFDERDLREFIDALTPDTAPQPDRDLARRCHRLSGGNAYFAEQLVLSGALSDPDASRVPESISELMLARIATLSTPARRVMQVAAATARRLNDRLLEAVCGLQDDVLDTALRECRNQGMLVVDPADETYAVQHALLSEAVYQQMGIGERRRLHTRMAEAMTADVALGLAQGWGAVELAHHWFHTDHRAEALATAVLAGEATMRMRAFHEAESQYGRVLDILWPLVPDPETAAARSRVDLLDAAAAASRWAGHVPQAVARIQTAIGAVGADQDPRRLGELYERLGSYHWENGAVAEGRAAYTDAVRLLETAAPDSASHSRALVGLAMADFRAGSYQAALERSERAVELAETTGDAAVKGRALNAAGLTLAMLGRFAEGKPRLEQAVELADQASHWEDLLGAYGNLALALELAGDLDGSVQAARAGLDRARALDVTELRLAIVLANNAAAALMLMGQWNEAGEVLRQAMDDKPRLELSAFLRLTVAEFDMARGEFAEAENLMSQVGDRGITDPRFVAAWHTCQAELSCWKDEQSRAVDEVRRGLVAVADTENVLVRVRLYSVGLWAAADWAARARAEGAQTSDAEELGAELVAAAERQAATQPEVRELQILLLLCRAEYRRATREDTVSLWDDVAKAWKELGRPYPVAYARWRQAAAAQAAGDEEAMAAAVTEAMDTAKLLGAEPLKAALEKLAAGLSPEPEPEVLPEPEALPDSQLAALVPAPPPAAVAGRPAIPYGLTPREWEIYRLLVVDAATNREIARTLTLVEATVATHVHRVYRKIGVQNRSAAMRKAYAEGLFEDP